MKVIVGLHRSSSQASSDDGVEYLRVCKEACCWGHGDISSVSSPRLPHLWRQCFSFLVHFSFGIIVAEADLLDVMLCSGENGQLRVGVRRASKQIPQARSTHFSSTNLHLGVLASAYHAAEHSMRFSVIFNPRSVAWMRSRCGSSKA